LLPEGGSVAAIGEMISVGQAARELGVSAE
jgi:hypothetical protein